MSNYIAQLGKIENGRDKVVVFATEEGFKLVFTSNGIRKECDLLDSDHVARELKHLGYSNSFIDVVLSML
jgi:hypothetical protein